MKKWLAMLSLAACLMMFAAVPAFADNMTNNNRSAGNEIRHDVNQGMNATNRALGTDTNRYDNSVRSNNYRANAAGDDDFNWGWLGLLGLLGLAGMRNRGRDRDRA